MPFLHLPPYTPPSPPASPSCPSPPSPLSYWEVFHEQLGPGRGEVSERGALCIIQWLSGVCMCVSVYICVCVWPSPSIGRCQVTGRPCHWLSAGFLLEQSHCSQHYHKLMRNARARLSTHSLICGSDVTRDHVTSEAHESFFSLTPFGPLFTLSELFSSTGKHWHHVVVWKRKVFKEADILNPVMVKNLNVLTLCDHLFLFCVF